MHFIMVITSLYDALYMITSTTYEYLQPLNSYQQWQMTDVVELHCENACP